MSQRFCLMYAGFCVSAPALYYNLVLLSRQIGGAVEEAQTKFSLLAQDLEHEQASNLRTAESIALSFEIKTPALPGSPEEYFQWLNQYVELFENNFPMGRIDHYYFLFGRKISELMGNLRLAATCLPMDASLNPELPLLKRIDKAVKDSEFILFKMIAPAALLSSESRQNFFNVYYKTINGGFEPFRGLDLSALDGPAIKKLGDDLKIYEDKVNEGLKECMTSLKQLGV